MPKINHNICPEKPVIDQHQTQISSAKPITPPIPLPPKCKTNTDPILKDLDTRLKLLNASTVPLNLDKMNDITELSSTDTLYVDSDRLGPSKINVQLFIDALSAIFDITVDGGEIK